MIQEIRFSDEFNRAFKRLKLTFVYIYDKSDFDNVSDEFLDQIIVDVGQGKYTSLSIGTPEA